MEHLNLTDKLMMVAGASARTVSVKTKRTYTRRAGTSVSTAKRKYTRRAPPASKAALEKKDSKRSWSYLLDKKLKSFDDISHKVGLLSITSVSATVNMFDSVEGLIKSVNKNPQASSYRANNYSSNRYGSSPGNNFVKPAMRFGAYPHRNSIMFGLPWA